MEPLTEGQRARAEDAAGWAQKVAARYARSFPRYADEIASSASWGAVRAAASYNPDLGGAWERWSRLCISGEIRNFLDSDLVRRSRQEGAAADDDDLARPDPSPARVDAAHDLRPLLSQLPDNHRALCELVYSQGMTSRQAGEALGYTPKHGEKLHREAIGILRRQLSD